MEYFIFETAKGSVFNLMENSTNHSDENLELLEFCAKCRLTLEQKLAAKLSILELSSQEITILDCVEAWESSPTLSHFAQALRRVFL